MSYGRCAFIDAAPGGLGEYDWQTNYSEESSFGQQRTIEHTATSDNVGVVLQQGEDSPLTMQLTGTIFHAAQHAKFVNFYRLTRNRTVIFRDFTGDTYEVIIASYQPTRHPTLRNPRDPTIPLHYWTYTMDLEVVRVISGAWA